MCLSLVERIFEYTFPENISQSDHFPFIVFEIYNHKSKEVSSLPPLFLQEEEAVNSKLLTTSFRLVTRKYSNEFIFSSSNAPPP